MNILAKLKAIFLTEVVEDQGGHITETLTLTFDQVEICQRKSIVLTTKTIRMKLYFQKYHHVLGKN